MDHRLTRRRWFGLAAAGVAGARFLPTVRAADPSTRSALRITGLKVTPVALPDPPILAASGCHGPYFLRHIVQVETDAGVVGIGETTGGRRMTAALERARELVIGHDAFAYRTLARELSALPPGCYAGIELACLDACGHALNRRLCDLLGGAARERVEFAAYLFYRYAADHPKILADSRIVDGRGQGDRALDAWGEVRSPEAMAAMAAAFRARWGFRVFKLKGGVLPPDLELETLRAMNARFEGRCPLRIDPNGRWRPETAVRIGKRLVDVPLEYYEDPVSGQAAMAEVRQATGLPMSTNMCVTRLAHVAPAIQSHPIDVLLLDHHYWGGIPACQAVGTLCDVAHWRASQHSNSHAGVTMAAMIHLAALVPQLTLASDTHYPWLPDNADLLDGPKLPIRDGHMDLPAGPGLGVRLDPDRLARAHEVYEKCGMREREDSTLMKVMEPGWRGEPL
jgi:glucarate dehydratase